MMISTSMLKTLPLLLFSFVFSLFIAAQDTLTVMHYNLLFYGERTDFCNNSNNNLTMKDPNLRLILNEIKPDIFTVNEISSSQIIHQHMLNENLNTAGVSHYRKANYNPISSSNIVNMLYYDSRKLRLKKQAIAQSLVRDIDVYELYYNSNDLDQGDTTFIICVVAHLKAGSEDGNRETRRKQVENTMQYLDARYTSDNVLFMGDFNFYSGYEPGFQLMLNYTNPAMRFIDPIGQIGDWNNNAFYAPIHTQSTHTSATSGCPAGGGMDDRFDFILISNEVRFGTDNVLYVPGSYKAFGQDGNRFNRAINDPPANTAASQQIADALFYFSDHLPVVLKLRVDKVLQTNEMNLNPFALEIAPNPVHNQLSMSFNQLTSGNLRMQIWDIQGQLIADETHFFYSGRQTYVHDLNGFGHGFYFIRLTDAKGLTEIQKFVRIN
jgi:endonuclease/exonuclease/phosphatase family metal-dependent hydrolase